MTRWRDAVGVVGALGVYKASVLPGVRNELAGWREVAAAIADPAQRETALAAIDEKGLNVEATAVFAILAPRRTRAHGDPSDGGAAGRDRLPRLARRAGLRRRPRLPRAPLRLLPGGRPGAAVPRRRRGRPRSRRRPLRRRAGADPRGRARRPRRARGLGPRPARPAVYRWWEVAAGASSSVAAHALIAAAAEPRTGAAEAARIDAAYFPSIGALTVLLDDLVDRDEDAAAGAHNYLAYYERQRGRGGAPRPRRPPGPRRPRRAAPPPPPRGDPRRRRRLLPQRRRGRGTLRAADPRSPAALGRPRGAADRRLHAPTAPRLVAPSSPEGANGPRAQGAPPGHDVCAHGPCHPGTSGTVRAWYQEPCPRNKRALPAEHGTENKNIRGPTCQPLLLLAAAVSLAQRCASAKPR